MKKISIIGTRGIPAKYGGFETFAEEIALKLVKKGFSVTVCCDKNSYHKNTYNGIDLVFLSTTKSEHPLRYYYKGIKWGVKNSDILLIAGTGGAFFYFLNLWARKIIITNTDGIESRRSKWSFIKQRLIKLSEILAIHFSDHLIADSKGISEYLLKNYPKLQNDKLITIEYGAPVNNILILDYLKKYQLEKDNYFLVVSRLEPENNLQIIIDGYKLSGSDKPLIIVGNCISNTYVNALIKNQSERIKFVGGIYSKEELCSLRAGSFAYIHGHSVGGTNPSLLEALGSSNICICHDNIFNREVTDNKQLYFSDANELKLRIEELSYLQSKYILKLKSDALFRITSYYNWENISTKYMLLLKKYETTHT